MPYSTGTQGNKSDDNNVDKKTLVEPSADLNANHKKQQPIKNIHKLSKKMFEQFNSLDELIFDQINSFINDSSSQLSIEESLNQLFNKIKAIFQKLEDDFPNLVKETDALKNLVGQLSLFKEMDAEQAYTWANKYVPLCIISENFDKTIKTKHKEIFLKLFVALSNTDIILAPLYKITLVKLGTLYQLYCKYPHIDRVVEMLAALFIKFTHDVPGRFKYKEVDLKDAIYGKVKVECSWLEICEQAYQENNLGTDKQEFQDTCKNLIMCYEGIIFGARIAEEKKQNLPETNLATIPNVINENLPDEPFTSLPQQSRAYFCLNDADFSILQNAAPKDRKSQMPIVFIPEIAGIAFDKYMRECLSHQRNIKDTRSEEMQQRTAAMQFLYKIQEMVHHAHADLINDITGKIFDAQQGYVSWNVQPTNLFEKIKKCHEEYSKYEIRSEACTLSGIELINKFFVRVFTVLNKNWEEKQLEWNKSYKIASSRVTMWNKKAALKEVLKLTEQKKQSESEYKQDKTRMESLKKIVQYVGSNNVKFFAAEGSGHAVYSIPKEQVDDRLLELIVAVSTSSNIEKSVDLGLT